ncbi:MAG: FHA domain-containing protein [Bacteroidota bacterium]
MALVWLLARLALAGLISLYLYRATLAAGIVPGPGRAPGVVAPGELEVEAGPGVPSPGERFPLGRVTVLGRSRESDVIILDPYVSSRHVEIALAGAGFVVRDLGSANGTYVNGRRLRRERVLRDGDRLELGDTAFRFRG